MNKNLKDVLIMEAFKAFKLGKIKNEELKIIQTFVKFSFFYYYYYYY